MSEFNIKYEETMIASNNEIGTWGQLAESLYEFLNRRNTTIEYSFDNMVVGVPKELSLIHI